MTANVETPLGAGLIDVLEALTYGMFSLTDGAGIHLFLHSLLI
jgi:hypothetical protein